MTDRYKKGRRSGCTSNALRSTRRRPLSYELLEHRFLLATIALQDGLNGYTGTRDTSIQGDQVTTNFGQAASLEVDGRPDKVSLIRWDTTTIPSASTVTAVSLTYNVVNVSVESYEIYRALRAWDETTATFQLAASGQPWQTPGAAGATDRGADVLGALTGSSLGLVTVPLNALGVAMVQSWITNPASNLGIVIQDLNDASSDGLDISSREQSGLGPKLTITYVTTPSASAVTVDTLLTNDTTPPLSGTVSDPSATISVTVGGQTRAAVNHGNGLWTLADNQLSPLAQGVYDVAVTATASGNSSTDVTTNELTIDTTRPVLTSFTRQTPSSSPTNADTLIFRATFNESVTNVSAGDFAVTGTTATVTNVNPSSPSVYDVTVSGGNLAGLNGTVGLNLASGQDIADLAGNTLLTTEPATDETYVVDNSSGPIVVALQDGLDGYTGTRDTSVRGDQVTTNYGNATSLEMDGSPDEVSLIRWDTTSIPSSSTVTAVSLTYNVVNVSIESYEVYRALRAWDESTATFQLAASGQPWQTPGAAGATDRGADVLGALTGLSLGLVTVPLNAQGVAMVQSWVSNPASNYGIVIQDLNDATSDGLDISSSESSSVTVRPKLTISFLTTPPPPVVTVATLLTNDPTPPLSGTVSDPSATISVTVGGQTKPAVNQGNGTWTLADNQLSPLAQGVYDVIASATASENTGTDVTTNELTVDTTPPSSVFVFPVDCQIYNAASWTDSITGTAADTGGGSVALVQVSVQRLSDNQFWSGTAFNSATAVLLNASGTVGWSFPFADTHFTDGDYLVAVRVTDTAGNIADAATAQFTFDTTPPPLPVVTVDTLLTNDTTPPLSGTVDNVGATISVTVGGQTKGAVNLGNGLWTLADNQVAPLAQGVYDVVVSATASGNTVTDVTTNELTIDTTRPSTILNFPLDGARYRSATWTGSILGTAVDTGGASLASVQVSVRRLSDNRYWSGSAWDQTSEYSLTATGTTNWNLPLSGANLTDGVSYSVTVHSTDTAGNIETKKTATFTFDTTRPVLNSFTRQTPSTSPTNADTLIFRATFNESVTNVSAGDFVVTGTTATVTNVNSSSPSVYDVTVSGGNLAGLNGTVGLNLASGQDIADLAGNTLPTTEPATDETYVVDNSSGPIVVALQDGLNGYTGTRDTSIQGDQVTTNFGQAASLEMDGSPDKVSLIRWDTTSIPSSGTVTAVSLNYNVTNTSNASYEVYRALRAWDESTATFQLAASGQPWQTPGAAGATDRGADILGAFTGPSLGLVTVPLNSLGVAMVQSWVSNPTSNLGIVIQDLSDASSNGLDISSREQSGLGPKLTITYTLGSPPPPPPNSDPIAVNDSITTTKNTSGSVNVLANDSDPDGDPITVSGNTQPSHGTLSQNGGTFTYTPANNYSGSDSFNYTIRDTTGRTASATVSIQVTDTLTPLIFRVMGDVPYTSGEYSALASDLANVGSNDAFFSHLGDIKSGSTSCSSSVYSNVANVLLASQKTVFIIPGDNEWNDCSNPSQAWGYWVNNFGRFDEHWTDPFTVRHQSQRDENFAFVYGGVLFMGINLVGGKVHDSQEWAQRMADNSQWVSDNLATYKNQVSSAVLFAHAYPDGARQSFGNAFVTAAQQFQKPILYLMGDLHYWQLDHPFSGAPNVTRVIVDQGVPSVRVTVTHNPASPFDFDRTP